MGKGASDNCVYIPTEHPSNIRNCLTLPKTNLSGRQIDALPTQLPHGYFKANAGPQGRFLKDEG
jgi:hypothetical protein